MPVAKLISPSGGVQPQLGSSSSGGDRVALAGVYVGEVVISVGVEGLALPEEMLTVGFLGSAAPSNNVCVPISRALKKPEPQQPCERNDFSYQRKQIHDVPSEIKILM